MPIIDCPSCGAKTNTAICPGWWDQDRKRAKCTGRIVNGKYTKGCGYDEADENERRFVDGLVKDQPGT